MLSRYTSKIVSVLFIALLLGCGANAESRSDQEIKDLVRGYLLENPEVIMEALIILQEKEELAKAEAAQNALQDMQSGLTQSKIDPIGGNVEGELTIVEFFDYNCGYCKRASSTLASLKKKNPNLRVVYKEWPILSPSSETAARVALAVNLLFPERYEELHVAFMNSSSLSSDNAIWAVVDKLKLDRKAIESKLNDEAVNQHLANTTAQARALGLTGTPAFVVGTEVIKGALPEREIQKVIDAQS
ncbi:DsbA family protein [Reinekea sp.]|jgi:protein-disulfide isomerase|uniref:DsbA family protein n=1 Tax=Reinekea sp. TaxID=1970455 RepID=UPI0039892897